MKSLGVQSTTDRMSSYATYAIPDDSVCEALLYYAPTNVHDIIDMIRLGHTHLNSHNKVDEFNRIGVQLPAHIDQRTLNDPVYQFCKSIRQFPPGTWTVPIKEDFCFSVSATANSSSDPAPFVAFKVLNTQCKHWTNVGIGVGAGYNDPAKLVTGVGHQPLKNKGVCFDPMAQRNRDHANSWKMQGRSIFNQMISLLGVSNEKSNMKNKYTKGYMYGCISHNFTESDATSQHHKEHDNTNVSWGNHEPWLQILQIAEMAVILHSIADGGSAFLKIRIFHDAQTQYMCALFASFFETFDLVPVSAKVNGHVLAHYKNKIKINEVNLDIITTFLLDHCVDSTMEVFRPPLWCEPTIEALQKVDNVSCLMKRYKYDSFHILATAVRTLKRNKMIENAFTSIESRIPQTQTQISMTTKLRNEMFPNPHHQSIEERNAHVVWQTFIHDIG
jgi:hypothetical protein